MLKSCHLDQSENSVDEYKDYDSVQVLFPLLRSIVVEASHTS